MGKKSNLKKRRDLLVSKNSLGKCRSIFSRIPSWIVVVFSLSIIVAVALWLRIALPYSQVFAGDWIKITGVDAQYYMRLVDNLMQHFPKLNSFDPYLLYPEGWNTSANPNFFVYFMGAIIWLISLGHTEQPIIDTIAVFVPPFLAVIVILMVFFIGKTLVNKWLGLLSAALLAIMPGEFLGRSILGYTDHHIAEILFSTGTMMFLFLSMKSVKNVDGWSVKVGLNTLIYSILGGVFLGLYVLTWMGSPIFLLIIFLFVVVQSIIEHMKGISTNYIGIIGLCIFGTCLIMYLPIMRDLMIMMSLIVGIMSSIFLVVISNIMISHKIRLMYYPLLIFMFGISILVALSLINFGLLQSMMGSLINIFQWHLETTVMEMQPLLIQQGNFSFAVAIGNYMLSFFFGLIMLLILFYQSIKYGRSDKVLFFIWSIVILASALAMRRFSYYYAVNVALLTGSLCWLILSFFIKKDKNNVNSFVKVVKNPRRISKSNYWVLGILLTVIVLLVYYPNIGPFPDGRKPAIDIASHPSFAPSNDWCEAEDWLRINTPELRGTGSEYSDQTYSVLSWWDYGYMTARIAQRAPTSNPGTGNRMEASYFVAQNDVVASRVISNLGVRYVIVDNEIASYNGKFHALASLSGSSYAEYYDVFVQKQDDKYVPAILFYPKYYYSMISRLYNFSGKSVSPKVVNVISCEKVMGKEGKEYKEIVDRKIFSSYGEAQSFIDNNRGYIIVGDDPFKSPVPLEELKNYSFVFESKNSSVKIFEYQQSETSLFGDWNGDTIAEIGSWKDCFLTYQDGDNFVKKGPFGSLSDVSISGDWNGDGKTEMGVWRPSTMYFYLDYNGDGIWDSSDKKRGPFGWGYDDRPVSGDFNRDGKDEIGIRSYRPTFNESWNSFYFYFDSNDDGKWEDKNDIKFGPFGPFGTDIPVIGDWNGDRQDEIGAWDSVSCYFYLDNDSNGIWDVAKDLKLGPIGKEYDLPISGYWNEDKEIVGVWDPYTRLFYFK